MTMAVAMVGRAWRTPLGTSINEVMSRLYSGERAALENPRAGGYACTLAAAITGEPARSRDARFLRRMGLYGLEVARDALAASGIQGGPRIGLFSGVGGLRAHWDDMLPALANQRDDGEAAWARGLSGVHPYWMLRHLSNNVHALASAELGLRGEGATFGGGTGGAQALVAAARALHDHAIDAALVVAYDSLLEPETLVELAARRAATHANLADLVAPYDAAAAGYVPGEAAAAIVLVRPADAASAIALVEATGTGDGGSEDPAPRTLQHALNALVRGVRGEVPGADELHERRTRGESDAPRSIATAPGVFVDGTGRAWPELDLAERSAIASTLSPSTALTAISAAIGQVGAATAVVQAIALAEALHRGAIPPVAGLANAAPGPCTPIDRATPTATMIAYGVSASAPGLAAAIRVEIQRDASDAVRAEVA